MTTHPLKSYRESTGCSLADLAEKAGTTRQSLSRIENGLQAPSAALMRSIELATGGKVTPSDLCAALPATTTVAA